MRLKSRADSEVCRARIVPIAKTYKPLKSQGDRVEFQLLLHGKIENKDVALALKKSET